jgi:hypothetical protein
MKRYICISLLASLVAGGLIFSGCDNANGDNGDATIPSVPENAEMVVSIAESHLAQELGIDMGEIEIFSLVEVEWFDASLGCPEPGMAYAQVVTPGFELVFMVDNQLYLYGTSEGDLIHYCGPISAEEIEERHINANYQDGWPNQPVYGGYVIIKSLED